MTCSPSSSWNLIDNQSAICAELQLGALTIPINGEKRNQGLWFKCLRSVDFPDEKIYDVFKNCVEGNAHLIMQSKDPNCTHEIVISGSGNKRGSLSECRCLFLNRNTYPEIRHNFENQVINALFESLKISEGTHFDLKLAIYCSGHLLGEQILLFRLMDILKRHKANGEIHLFLIDSCYKDLIDNSTITGSDYSSQFLKELCLCLPSSITVQGAFFNSAEDYIEMASRDAHFKHHLLIGPDLDKSRQHLAKISRAGAEGAPQPIKLVKSNNKPVICKINLPGKFEDFYKKDDRLTAFQATGQKPKTDSSEPSSILIYAAEGVLLIGAVIGIMYVAKQVFKL